MSELMALVTPEVYALAMSRPWPEEPADQVRCIESGARALGAAVCCPPWSRAAEDEALTHELALSEPEDDPFVACDEVAGWLADTSAAPPVMALVSGPVSWNDRHAAAHDEDGLEATADLAARRVRQLADAGVDRVAVLETIIEATDPGAVRDAHRPLCRAADLLGVDAYLVTVGDEVSLESLGYQHWVSPASCSAGLGLLAAPAFDDRASLDAAVAAIGSGRDVLTARLGPAADVELIRAAASALASTGSDRE